MSRSGNGIEDGAGRLSPVFLGALLGHYGRPDGDVLSGYFGECLRRLAASALQEVVGRPVTLSRLGDDTEQTSPSPQAACCRFVLGEDENEFIVGLDAAAARAIVEPLLADHLGIRVAGSLLEAEQGILEYVVSAWADQLAHRVGLARSCLIVRAVEFADRSDERRLGQNGSYAWRLDVGSRSGRLTLHVPARFDFRSAFALLGAAVATSDAARAWATARCTLRVALPPVVLDAADVDAAKPGDVLLLGRSSLVHPSAGPTLCTDAGWALGRVQIRHDSATMVSVELLNIDPWPQVDSDEVPIMRILIGRLELTGQQLAALVPGTVLDLAKETHSDGGDMLLRLEDRAWAWGQLLKARGELGVRITHLIGGNSIS